MAGATIGTNALHQAGLPTYAAAANAAEIAQRPAGFADLVEKVKPAVISVRVKVKAGSEMISFDGDMPFPEEFADGAVFPSFSECRVRNARR